MNRLMILFFLPVILSGLPGLVRAQYLSTIAGVPGNPGNSGDGGPSSAAKLQMPMDVAVDGAGNFYIADYYSHVVRKINGQTGIISTFAGNGSTGTSGDGGLATDAPLGGLYGVTVDANGNVYITDDDNSIIRKVDGQTGIITTVAGDPSKGGNASGDGGPATAAGLGYPSNTAVDANGNIYISEYYNRVRKVDGQTGIITTVAGGGSNSSLTYSGPATGAALGNINYCAVDNQGILYIADGTTIRKVDLSGNMTTVAGNGGSSPYNYTGPAVNAGIYSYGVRIDGAGNIYVSDGATNSIRKIDVSGNMSNYAGNGVQGYGGDGGLATASAASLSGPYGMALDAQGNLYVAEQYNHIIRKIGGLAPAQTITFPDITTYVGFPDFVPTGSASSGLPLTFTVADFFTARVVNGDTVHLIKAGTTTITAIQVGNFSWQAASAQARLIILEPTQTISFSNIDVPVSSSDFALTAVASSGLPVSYSIADPTVATITNGVVHVLQSGVTTITASQAGDGGSWTPAPPVTVTLSVTEDIAFSDITRTYGDADFSLTATSAGGQPVYYTVGDASVASIVGSSLHILKAGTTTISVGFAGVTGTPVTKILTIGKAPLTITADNQQKQQGQDNPLLTVSYSGFVNDENNTALIEQPTVATTAISSSPVGSYPIAVSGATAANYQISNASGTLTIVPAAGSVTVDGLNALIIGGTLQAQVASVKGQQAVLQLVDMAGRVLVTQNVSLSGGMVNTFQIPVFNLAHGAYIVSVRGGGLRLSDKIIY